MSVRFDWSLAELQAIYDMPLMELVYRAAGVHRQHHAADEVQVCRLISIKTGACPEDCKYCSQSVRYQTSVEPEPLMALDEVRATAEAAKAAGVTRVCMGAAWRGVKDNADFDRVLDMVRDVTDMGVEVCCTLGLLNEGQAEKLQDAGLYAYNHNLDTSEKYYGSVITTRKYADRLRTLANVRKTKVTICSGGIIGLGETISDRLEMLQTLASFEPHPESVPINLLSRVPGTPFADQPEVPAMDMVRMIAVTRIIMPRAVVRISAGRHTLSTAEQALCFMAGANSIFSSELKQMLTKAAPSADYEQDKAMLAQLGLKIRPPFKDGKPEHAKSPGGGAATPGFHSLSAVEATDTSGCCGSRKPAELVS